MQDFNKTIELFYFSRVWIEVFVDKHIDVDSWVACMILVEPEIDSTKPLGSTSEMSVNDLLNTTPIPVSRQA